MTERNENLENDVKSVPPKQIEAEIVEIKTPSKRIAISRPKITVMQINDKEIWQIEGDVSEYPLSVGLDKNKHENNTKRKESDVVSKIEELDYCISKTISNLKNIYKKKQ